MFIDIGMASILFDHYKHRCKTLLTMKTIIDAAKADPFQLYVHKHVVSPLFTTRPSMYIVYSVHSQVRHITLYGYDRCYAL